MIRKNTWILIGVFALLAGAVYLMQKNEEKIPFLKPTLTPTVFRVLDLSEPEIVRVELTGRDNRKMVAERNATGWNILTPSASSLSPGSIESAIAELATLRAILSGEISLTPDSVGLSKPLLTIRLTDTKGSDYQVDVGDQTSIQNGYYVRVNKDKMMVGQKAGIDSIISLIDEAYATPTPESIVPFLTPGP